jgi:hypothetical protein
VRLCDGQIDPAWRGIERELKVVQTVNRVYPEAP